MNNILLKNQIFLNLIIALLLVIIGCSPETNFRTSPTGLQYQFLTQKDTTKVKIGDVLELEMKILSPKNKIVFTTKDISSHFRMKLKKPSHKGGCFEDALAMMHPTERALFYIDAYNFYTYTQKTTLPENLKKGDKIKFEIFLKKIVSKEEILSESKKINRQKQEAEQKERIKFLENQKLNVRPTKSGLFIIKLKDGRGKMAKKGNRVSVHYVGKFINGKPFDSSIERGKPFDFVLGQGRVIKAWEEALPQMKEGEKVLLIVPSNLAYGKVGYKNLIKPYSTLIFEIKLIKIYDK